MAYIIGLIKPEEVKEIKRRGWEVEPPPPDFKIPDSALRDGLQYGMVYVDSNLLQIISGPDWDKGPTKKTSVKVIISDIKVTDREVELPTVCPVCGEDLTDPDGKHLRVWEYSDQERDGHLTANQADSEGSFGTNTGDVLGGGESFINNVAIWCSCGHELVGGKFECESVNTKEEVTTYSVEYLNANEDIEVGWHLYDSFIDLPTAQKCINTLILRASPSYAALRIVHTVKTHDDVNSFVLQMHPYVASHRT